MPVRLCLSCLTLLALALAACGLGAPPTATLVPAPVPTTAPTRPDPATAQAVGESGCPMTQASAAADSAVVTMGPGNGVTILPEPEVPEQPLVIVGTVYDEACVPVAGARLNLWQTNGDGVYGPGQDSNALECCYLQGTVRTDDEGNFQLITIRPGHYKDASPPPPAHIHVEVIHPDIEEHMTEIVFADDPYVPPNGSRSGLVVASLTYDAALAALFGTADIVVERRTPAVNAAEAGGQVSGSGRTFAVVPAESQVSYEIREKFADWPAQNAALGFTRLIEGTLRLGLDGTPALHELSLTVDLRGLRSDDPQRDEKLADRWLVTNDFPYASFTATGVQSGPAAYKDGQEVRFTLAGDLTIRDVTRATAFEVSAALVGDTLQGTAETSILMTDFGIDPPDLLGFVKVEDEVLLTVQLTARENTPGPWLRAAEGSAIRIDSPPGKSRRAAGT
jgi:protocatechuate 3,4-dioxygenase beta subunit/polyisoprenoid-binding protein YceI